MRDRRTPAHAFPRRRFGEDVLPCVANLLSGLGDGPGRDEIAAAISDSYRPGASWVDAFARMLAGWLAPYGIVFVNPDDAALKRLMGPVFRAEMADPDASHAVLAEREEAIRAAGYAPQVGRTERATLLFVDDTVGARARLDHAESGFSWGGDAGGPPEFARADDLLRMFENAPDRFSANAILRPVSGDVVFPTLMHVMGPSEIAYMAQARGVYERHGVPVPIVAPRAGFTVVEPEIASLLDSEGLGIDEAFQDVDRWFGRLADAEYDARWDAEVDALRQALDAAYDAIGARVGESMPGIRTATTSARMKSQAIASRYARKIEQEIRRTTVGRRVALGRISDALYPLGHPQERVYTAVPFLVRHRMDWIAAIHGAIDPERATHYALFPDD